MDDNYTLETAVQARDDGRLEPWIHDFLCSPGGNKALSDGLKLEQRRYWGPVEMPLALVGRCCGPEEGMAYPVPAEGFGLRVGRIQAALAEGRSLPPLLVNYDGGRLTLNDGNHRHEAHRRRGTERVPVIFWTTGEEPMAEFRRLFGAGLREIGR